MVNESRVGILATTFLFFASAIKGQKYRVVRKREATAAAGFACQSGTDLDVLGSRDTQTINRKTRPAKARMRNTIRLIGGSNS
jgi:hypothetical protein